MNIGTLLRKHRKERKLTLREVAEQASISEGFLSQVENDVNSPSVETLMRICGALDVEAGNLLTQVSSKDRAVLIRKNEWDDIDLSHTGFVTRRFFPPEDRRIIDSSILVIEPGKSIPVRKNIKNGQEVICVLKGQVALTLADDTFDLSAGDSIHFWSFPENQRITGCSKRKSYVLWVGTL